VIDPGFLGAALDPGFRHQARLLLIAKYFHAEDRTALYALCNMNVPSEDVIAEHVRYQPINEATERGRDARFRIVVVSNYMFTCALTGYRLTTVSSGTIVDAAHIHDYSKSRNNDPRNGMSLCRNAHWMFDKGLWTLTDEYTVLVAKGHFDEACMDPSIKRLTDFHEQKIHLPFNQMQWPDPKYIKWHRDHRFKRD
jgi:putative restriction endonuclease